jgi:K(+)-stimulated pyrophosphate-energized sodium pump
MNILIKLMSIVSLVLAPTLAGVWSTKNISEKEAAKRNVERSINYDHEKSGAVNTLHLK